MEDWYSFHIYKEYFIHFQRLGEVRYGPVYVELKSNPSIPFIEQGIYGERRQSIGSGGVLIVERWSSTVMPDFEIIGVDFEHKTIFKACHIEDNYLTWRVIRWGANDAEVFLRNEITGTETTKTYRLELVGVF
ncbi:MAG TPA: hypothetical protein PKE53_15385 [Flavobacteriales bacterium]|nr:hypothetical protein [Flavobacteriales bacterium]